MEWFAIYQQVFFMLIQSLVLKMLKRFHTSSPFGIKILYSSGSGLKAFKQLSRFIFKIFLLEYLTDSKSNILQWTEKILIIIISIFLLEMRNWQGRQLKVDSHFSMRSWIQHEWENRWKRIMRHQKFYIFEMNCHLSGWVVWFDSKC